MQRNFTKALKLVLAVALFGIFLTSAPAALYTGNGDTSFGGAVGSGSLNVADNGTTLSFQFNRGGGSLNDALVIFIDSTSGGFGSTAGFNDQADGLRHAISGVSGGNRATANFASGFAADYVIALNKDFAGVWQLANGNDNSLNYLGTANLSSTGGNSANNYNFNLNLATLGVAANSGAELRFSTTYISESGYRSGESFNTISGSPGWNTMSFTDFDSYLTAVPEPTTIALGIFGFIGGVGGVWRWQRSRASA
jgi:hypothetical protein